MGNVVFGASGTIGRAVVEELGIGHSVTGVSRQSELSVDLADRTSIQNVFDVISDIDAVICCAANAPLMALGEDAFVRSLQPKLFGQVELARIVVERLRDGGSITLTSGVIPAGLADSAGGALVNAGLEAFVRVAAHDMPRGLRLNVVSPGWVCESLQAAGMDPRPGTPAHDVAGLYRDAVEGNQPGQTLT